MNRLWLCTLCQRTSQTPASQSSTSRQKCPSTLGIFHLQCAERLNPLFQGAYNIRTRHFKVNTSREQFFHPALASRGLQLLATPTLPEPDFLSPKTALCSRRIRNIRCSVLILQSDSPRTREEILQQHSLRVRTQWGGQQQWGDAYRCFRISCRT